MTNKRRTEAEWIKIIQACKSSGYSDIEWCRMNNIPVSTFYRKLSILRHKACVDDLTKPVIRDEQEVVEVNLHQHQTKPVSGPAMNTDIALRLNINGVTIEILNNATKATIENTLHSLRALC